MVAQRILRVRLKERECGCGCFTENLGDGHKGALGRFPTRKFVLVVSIISHSEVLSSYNRQVCLKTRITY